MFYTSKHKQELEQLRFTVERLNQRLEIQTMRLHQLTHVDFKNLQKDVRQMKTDERYGFNQDGTPRQKPGRKPMKGTS